MSKGFYEPHRGGESGFMMVRKGDYAFPPHFHQNVEIFITLSGGQRLTVDATEVETVAGSVVVIDNYAVHSYGESKRGDTCLIIIPYDMLSHFNRIRRGKVFKKIHTVNFDFAKDLIKLAENYLYDGADEYVKYSASNMIISLIVKELGLSEGSAANEGELINKILFYVENNFKEDISLKSAAKSLGYAEGYLSRIFHRYVSESFPRYVNNRRLDYVQRELESCDKNVTQLIFEAGFNSFQTYYRTKSQAQARS